MRIADYKLSVKSFMLSLTCFQLLPLRSYNELEYEEEAEQLRISIDLLLGLSQADSNVRLCSFSSSLNMGLLHALQH